MAKQKLALAQEKVGFGKKVVDIITNFMSNIEFFTYNEDALDIFEEDTGKTQKPGYVKFAKKVLKILIGIGLVFAVFYEFL